MLKKIKSSQLRPGMYLQELCSSWISSPFWQKSFLIDDENQIKKIVEARIQEAWIDTSKGLDVASDEELAPVDVESVEPLMPSQDEMTSSKFVPTDFSSIEQVSMDAELGRAAQIVGKSKKAVFSMFNEASKVRLNDRWAKGGAGLPRCQNKISSWKKHSGIQVRRHFFIVATTFFETSLFLR